ncbi:MAG: hypothetical protein H6835_17105 [Planctomycetes bacterium]|nr:hypothetical protein [Planctomycetota bacterium]
MNQIDRRSLFSLGLGAAGASMAPKWLSRWFAAPQEPVTQDPQKAHDPYPKKTEQERVLAAAREEQLKEAIEQAREQHKPLLVFVVPDRDVTEEGLRGGWFGAFVTHARDLVKLEIGMTVPCCAKPSEVKKLLDAEVVGTPTMMWVDVGADGEKSHATPVEVELGEFRVEFVPDEKPEDYDQRAKRHVEQGLAAMGDALIAARHRHGASLAALAKANAEVLTDAEKQQLELWLAGNKLPKQELLVRATAFVRHAMEDFEQPRRAARSAQLVAAIDAVVVHEELAGARWRRGGGCGGEYEHPTPKEKEQSGMIACGMGMMPPLAERFLTFYVQQQ